MKGQERVNTYNALKTEAEVKALLSGKPIHCVKCKKDLVGNEVFDYSIKNKLSLNLRSDSGINVGVPALICSCGYKNTVLKLLAQV